MERRIQYVFLALVALISPMWIASSFAQPSEEDELDHIVASDIKRRSIKEDDLDSENFELGMFFGLLSMEDFGTNGLQGFSFSYHITEDFFAEATYATSRLGKTSYEILSGGVELLTPDQRKLNYYNLSLGYNFLPGQIYISDRWTFNNNFYLIAGAGNTDFAGKKHFTTTLGAGLRFYSTDWLAFDVSMRNHGFNHDLFGKSKSTNNLESRLGLSVFF